MDKPIAARKWRPGAIVLVAGLAIASLALISLTIASSGRTRLSIDGERLSVSQVRRGELEEYVPIDGRVQPSTSVFLDLAEGGIVEQIAVESGNPVRKGDLILRFANNAAQKENIETETRLLENLNELRNSKISLTTSNLMLQEQLLDLQYTIQDLEARYARAEQLMKSEHPPLSRQEFESLRDQLAYQRNKRALLRERIRKESELERQQTAQIEVSISRVNRNLEVLTRIAESLAVRAPVDGQLSSLTAEAGQSFQRGERIGQIDQLDSFKVQADVDQYYISKVAIGQTGKFEMDGRHYQLRVSKVYPEVAQDAFQVDLMFVGDVPAGIRRGQRLQIDLSLSESRTTNIIDKGGFYRHTNGRWVYRVASDGRSARRTNVVLGRENPQSVEVLEGLEVGDWVITSSYEGLNDVDELKLGADVINSADSGPRRDRSH